jgi:hypothetical protein
MFLINLKYCLDCITKFFRFRKLFLIRSWLSCVCIFLVSCVDIMPLVFQKWFWLYGGRLYTLLCFVVEPFWFIGAYFVFLRYVWRLLNRFIFSGFHPMKKWQICALLIVLFILLFQLFIFVLSYQVC